MNGLVVDEAVNGLQALERFDELHPPPTPAIVVLDNRMPNKLVETSVSLRRGWHDVTLRYRARTGHFHVYLFWTPPGASREIVPTEFLRPHGTGGPPQEPFPKRGASALEGRVHELSENGERPG